jgi:hypothetical protein
MTFNDIPQANNPFAFESFGHWAKELQIPARSLLHHAACGYLQVFALPPHEVDFYAIHEEFAANPVSAPTGTTLLLSAQGLGLILEETDLFQLAAGKLVEASRFYALIRKNAGWTEIVPPIPNRSDTSEQEPGWRVVAFRRAAAEDTAHRNTPEPVSLRITPTSLYVRNMDVAMFAKCLLSGQFVNDLIIKGIVTEELPEYVSGKLREMVDANRLYWRGYRDIDLSEKERRRTETRKYLQEDFWRLCDKKSKPGSLLDFAADACDPASVPESQRLDTASATPDLRAMLTAAKLFWSPHWIYKAGNATQPSRESIEDVLRFMGMRKTNTASSATTILRPEKEIISTLPERRTTTLLNRRQALPR